MPRVIEPVNGRDGIEPRFVCLTLQLILFPLHHAALHKAAGVVPGADGMGAQECKMTISKTVKLLFHLYVERAARRNPSSSSLKKLAESNGIKILVRNRTF